MSMETGAIISLCSLALAVIVFLSNGRKDTRTDAAKEARTDAKLDSIANGVTEIRVEMRTMQSKLDDHSQRIAAVESSAKSAHRRLDELENLFHTAHPPS